MAEAKAAAIEPGRVVSHVNAERFESRRHCGSALSTVDLRIIDRIFRDDLVVVTGGMHRGCDGAHVHELAFFHTLAHGIDPLAVMDNFFRNNKRFAHLIENAAAKLSSKKLDMIAANDISASDAGFAVDTNRITLLYADGRQDNLALMSKSEVAEQIIYEAAEFLEQ